MGEALEAGLDLSALAGIYLLIGLLAVIAYTFARLAAILDFSVFGQRPLHNVASGIQSVIVDGCNDGIKSLQSKAASFQSGLIDAFGMIIALPALLYLGLRAALEYLWSSALNPLIAHAVNPVRASASDALAKANAARSWAETQVDRLDARIGRDTQAALSQAEAFAVSQAQSVAATAQAALLGTYDRLEGEIAGLRTGLEGEVASSVDILRRAEEQAQALATAAIGATAGELRDLERQLPLGDIATAVAAVPLLRAIIQTLETETGLENESCRRKVKGICSVDPARWERLIAGLVLTAEWPGLADFAEGVAELTGDVVDAIADLAGV